MDVESRIAEVTLYARGARVRRMATVVLGGAELRLTGLPAALIDDSVRAFAEGDAMITAVHVGLDAPDRDAAADEEVPEVRAARERAALVAAEVERLEAAVAAVGAAPIAPPVPVERGEAPPAWAAVVEARRQLVALRAGRELALRDQLAQARRDADQARRQLAAAVDRERRASTDRAARLHELRKHVALAVTGRGEARVVLEYQVAAARWAPSYVARLDGERVTFELRAQVAQATGEDWIGAQIRLSTAEPERFSALPELSPQRIGRRQPEPARAGFRAPPVGAEALYGDYLRAFPEPPRRRRSITSSGTARSEATSGVIYPPAFGASADVLPAAPLSDEVWDEDTSRAKRAYAPGAPLAAQAAPMSSMAMPIMKTVMGSVPRSRRSEMTEEAAAVLSPSRNGRGPGAEPVVRAVPPPPAPRLDYADLRMAPPDSPERGALIPAPLDPRRDAADEVATGALERIVGLALPAGCAASWPHAYDYAYAGEAAIDVRADATWHSIAIAARPTTASLRHVAAPRVQPEVFRIAAIANPLPGPLLPGPIDIYDRGTFLVTSAVEHTPPGASVEVGLGVDAQVKLARNTEFREESAGMLRGALRLHHAIKIDVDNLSDRAIDLEVRERLPVTHEGDDDVAVTLGRVEPAWERWIPDPEAPGAPRLRGGYRWRLAVPANAQRSLRAAYEVKISGKHELVGGNRREA